MCDKLHLVLVGCCSFINFLQFSHSTHSSVIETAWSRMRYTFFRWLTNRVTLWIFVVIDTDPVPVSLQQSPVVPRFSRSSFVAYDAHSPVLLAGDPHIIGGVACDGAADETTFLLVSADCQTEELGRDSHDSSSFFCGSAKTASAIKWKPMLHHICEFYRICAIVCLGEVHAHHLELVVAGYWPVRTAGAPLLFALNACQ